MNISKTQKTIWLNMASLALFMMLAFLFYQQYQARSAVINKAEKPLEIEKTQVIKAPIAIMPQESLTSMDFAIELPPPPARKAPALKTPELKMKPLSVSGKEEPVSNPIKPLEHEDLPQEKPPAKLMTVKLKEPIKSVTPLAPTIKAKMAKPANMVKNVISKLETTEAKSEHIKPATPVLTSIDKDKLAKGRVMLRNIEHGKGPSITVHWPQNDQNVNRLYQVMTRCFGMQSLVLGNDQEFYDLKGKAEPNTDYFSHYMRYASGMLPLPESRLRALAVAKQGKLVRLYPRNFDALLLGVLSDYANLKDGKTIDELSIEGRLGLEGQHDVRLTHVVINQQKIPLVVSLNDVNLCRKG